MKHHVTECNVTLGVCITCKYKKLGIQNTWNKWLLQTPLFKKMLIERSQCQVQGGISNCKLIMFVGPLKGKAFHIHQWIRSWLWQEVTLKPAAH